MSVTFYPAIVTGRDVRPLLRCACEQMRPTQVEHQCAACLASLNVNNRNASDLLAYLGLEVRTHGHMEASKLVELCGYRLTMVHVEAAIPTVQRGNVIECGRAEDYLPQHAHDLLVIATLARGMWVAWS